MTNINDQEHLPARPGTALLFMLVGLCAYITMVVLAALGLFGGDAASIKGLSWVMESVDRKLIFFLAIATAPPVSAIMGTLAWTQNKKNSMHEKLH